MKPPPTKARTRSFTAVSNSSPMTITSNDLATLTVTCFAVVVFLRVIVIPLNSRSWSQ